MESDFTEGGVMTIRAKGCLGLVSLTLMMSACSGGESDAVTSTTVAPAVTSTTVAPAVQALPYFEELAKNSRVGFDTAEKMSTGVASEYAKYQNEYEQAIAYATADGQTFTPQPLETAKVDESGRILLESTEQRITFSDFSFTGKSLSDFKVEGRELSGNFNSAVYVFKCFTDSECDSDDSYDFGVLHSYVSASGALVVTYSFRIGSKSSSSSVREDRTSKGLPNHEVVDSSGTKIGATFGIQTFARGETRVNVVVFGPLMGGGKYTGTFRFRWGGYLYEYKDIDLGTFEG